MKCGPGYGGSAFTFIPGRLKDDVPVNLGTTAKRADDVLQLQLSDEVLQPIVDTMNRNLHIRQKREFEKWNKRMARENAQKERSTPVQTVYSGLYFASDAVSATTNAIAAGASSVWSKWKTPPPNKRTPASALHATPLDKNETGDRG